MIFTFINGIWSNPKKHPDMKIPEHSAFYKYFGNFLPLTFSFYEPSFLTVSMIKRDLKKKQIQTVHPPICGFFMTQKFVHKSGESPKRRS